MFGRKRVSDHDFLITDLPSNHYESFFDIIKNRWTVLMLLGLFFLLFSLPIVIKDILTNIALLELAEQFNSGLITSLAARNEAFRIQNLSDILNIPLAALFSLTIAGSLRILRQLIWQEGLFFGNDYYLSIKQNSWHTIVVFTFWFLLLFTFKYLLRISQLEETSWHLDLALGISLAAVFLFIPLFLLALFQTSIYQLPLHQKLKNALLMTVATAPKTLIMTLLIIAPWALLLINTMQLWLEIGLWILLMLVVLPLLILAFNEYAFNLFDRFINQKHHPDIYQKGLWTSCQSSKQDD